MDDVDYEFWLKKESWSELEARFLLTGLTPFYDWKQSFLSDDFFYYKDEEEIEEIKDRFEEIVKALVDAINYESITQVGYQGDGILVQGGGFKAQKMDVLKITRYFNKAELIKWAIDEGIKPPKELFNWYMKHQAQTTKEVSTLAIHPSSYFWGLVNDQDLAEQDLKAELEPVKEENERLKAENEALKKQIAEQKKENLSESERDSLLKLVLGMAMAKYNYEPSKNRNTATGEKSGSIYADLENVSLKIDADTIRKYLKEAGKFLTEADKS